MLVHDAARPLVDDDVIERLLGQLADGVDGAVPALPLDRHRQARRGRSVTETLDRDALVVVQTPQAFVADRLRSAYAGDLAGATDCAALVERAGGRIALCWGSAARQGDHCRRPRAVTAAAGRRSTVTTRAVFFDVGETLVDEERYWRAVARAAGIGPTSSWAALGKTIERGEEHWELWRHLGVERPADAWGGVVYSTADLYPDALDASTAFAPPAWSSGWPGTRAPRSRSGRDRPRRPSTS